jgi:hypothetical protein
MTLQEGSYCLILGDKLGRLAKLKWRELKLRMLAYLGQCLNSNFFIRTISYWHINLD